MARSDRQKKELKSEYVFLYSETSMNRQDFDMSSCSINDVFNSRDCASSPLSQIDTFLKNVQVLLEAASFIENAERKDGSKFICVTVFPPVIFRETRVSLSTDARQQRAEFIQLIYLLFSCMYYYALALILHCTNSLIL